MRCSYQIHDGDVCADARGYCATFRKSPRWGNACSELMLTELDASLSDVHYAAGSL